MLVLVLLQAQGPNQERWIEPQQPHKYLAVNHPFHIGIQRCHGR